MINRKRFFASIRASLFKGRLAPAQVAGMERLLTVWEDEHADRPLEWLAYCLATSYHETAHTLMPVMERGERAYFNRYDIAHNPAKARELGNVHPGDGFKFRGAGDVQATGRRNYEKMGKRLGLPLVTNPELALDPKVSARMLFTGMIEGLYTGKKLDDFAPNDFIRMRSIVNGIDKAALIAGYAEAFRDALTGADEPAEPPAGKITTEKPATQSTQILAQIGSCVVAFIGAVGSALTDWRVLSVAVFAAVLVAAWWTIRENRRKAREFGV